VSRFIRPRLLVSPPPESTSGYPDASNTGVPAGTTLTPYNADFYTSSNGQVIDALDIHGSLIVSHTGVTVTRCRISQWSIFGVDCEVGAHSLTMSDSMVDGGVGPGTCVVNSNFTLLRCDIKGAENGLDVGSNVVVQDCFIHDLFNSDEAHADGIQFNDGVSDVIIQHNTILSRGADGTDTTSCIISPPAFTGVTNVTITDNVFAGGAFSLYGPQGGSGTNVTITDNKFWTLYFAGKSGAFGSWTDAADESVVSGNQLGAFSGGYNAVTKRIVGDWSGVPLT
jgi:hypothetical protein